MLNGQQKNGPWNPWQGMRQDQKAEISAEQRLAVWRDFGKWRSLARLFDN
jgi:hypothetical protein